MDTFYYPYYKKITDNMSVITTPSNYDSMGDLKNLPCEVINKIFEQISELNLFGIAKVCRSFAMISKNVLNTKLKESNLSSRHSNLIEHKVSNTSVTEGDNRNPFKFQRSLTESEREIVRYRLTEAGSQKPHINGLLVYPSGYFNPEEYLGNKPKKGNNDKLKDYGLPNPDDYHDFMKNAFKQMNFKIINNETYNHNKDIINKFVLEQQKREEWHITPDFKAMSKFDWSSLISKIEVDSVKLQPILEESPNSAFSNVCSKIDNFFQSLFSSSSL